MRGKDLIRPVRGVYLAAAGPIDFASRCQAVLRRVSPDAFLCGSSAARALAVPLPGRIERSTVVDIGVFSPSSPPEGRGIRGHCLELPTREVRELHGMRITSPEETWCSLGTLLGLTELVAAGDFLIHHEAPLTSINRLARRVEAWQGKRGVRRLRHALGFLNPRSESPKESELRVIVVEAGIRGLEANYRIRTSGGYDYRGDLAFPSRKVIVEYQSAFHETPESFRSDMTRISRLEADGWKVIQVNKDDLRNPRELASRIRRVLAR
jgi:very-short-patch-repair endonuclease